MHQAGKPELYILQANLLTRFIQGPWTYVGENRPNGNFKIMKLFAVQNKMKESRQGFSLTTLWLMFSFILNQCTIITDQV